MNLNEFKAWLDGFSEAIGDSPTPEQWAKVREKLAQTHPLSIFPTAPAPMTIGDGPYAPVVVSPFTRPINTVPDTNVWTTC